MLKKIKILFISLVILFAMPKSSVSIDATVLPPLSIMGSTKLEWRICKIRRLFCGQTADLVIAMAIFTIGFLILIGKMNWPLTLMSLTGIFLFFYADTVANSFQKVAGGRVVIIFNPICSCSCPLGDDFLDQTMKAIDAGSLLMFLDIDSVIKRELSGCLPAGQVLGVGWNPGWR